MDAWLDFARGPFFRFTFAVMVLGLGRHVIVALASMYRAYRLTAHQDVAWGRTAVQTVDWLIPLRHLRQRGFYTVVSILFHVGVIVTPLFLFGHIRLIESNLGLWWPALPTGVADGLALMTLAALATLVIARLVGRASRSLSRLQDYAVPLLLAVPFATGYLIANPGLNPLPHNPTLLAHMLSAGICFLIIPFTKLAHMALQPLTRLPADLAWRFPDHYPEAVARQIGTEGQPI
jgi:nitrate reductase gamma subunit